MTGRPTYRESLAALQAAQKTPRGVSLYSIHVNRPWGRRLAAVAHVLGLTPNQVTVLSAAASFGAIGLLVTTRPTGLIGVAVAFLLALAFALDAADGQLARLRQTFSRQGEWLDHIVDCSVKLGLHLAVFIAWDQYVHSGATLLVPLAYQVVAVLIFFGGTLTAKLLEKAPRATGGDGHGLRERLSRVALLPADHGTLCLAFLLWGFATPFLVAYSVLLAANAALLGAYLTSWWRDLG